MPRRPPPTPLRLYEGPIPPRSRPRHTLPSVPRPTYIPRVPTATGLKPRVRAQHVEAVPGPLHFNEIPSLLVYSQLTGILMPSESVSHSRRSSWSDTDGPNSPVSIHSTQSSSDLSRRSSYESLELSDDGRGGATHLRPRGPWDHSSSIKIPFDVSTVLTPPRPAAVTVSAAR